MKSKQQKIAEVDESKKLLKDAGSLVFVDFSKTSTKFIDQLKKLLGDNGVFKIIKKRLLNLVLKDKNIPLDAKALGLQVGTVFGKGDVSETAGLVWQFFKGKEKELPEFKMLAGFDLSSATLFDAVQIKRIGQLPPREILLAQLLGMLQAPVRSLAYTLSEVAKKK